MRCLPPWRERVMISCGGGFQRAGRRCVGSKAVDPIGVALSITAGERSHLRTGPTHHSDPMGVELHADVMRTAGFSVVTIGRTAASLLRGCACGLPAVMGSWTPMGSTYPDASFPQVRLWLTRGYRKFAPYGGIFCRMGICLRRYAIPCVSHVPNGHTVGRDVVAGLRPERVRRDESRLYVADGPCGREGEGSEADGLKEAGLCVTSGGAQRNPRWGG